MLWRFMLVPIISLSVAVALALSFMDLRRDSLSDLEWMQTNIQQRVKTIVGLGSQLAETYANVYQLLLDVTQYDDEAQFYRTSRPHLNDLHQIEAGLRRELELLQADPELAREITELLGVLQETRVGATNALLMSTVDFDLATEQIRGVTRHVSDANRRFLYVEFLLHENLDRRIETINDNLRNRSRSLGIFFAVVFVLALAASIWLIELLLRDLRRSVLSLSRITRLGSDKAALPEVVNEIVLLDRAIEDASFNCNRLLETQTALERSNASLKVSFDAIKKREESLSAVNAELNSKIDALNKAIRERDEAEFALSKAQRMEVIGNLTGGVAHDFNNILAVVLGNLELLKGEDADEAREQLIDAAIEATHRGADLSKNMLAFARRARLEPKVLDLNTIVLSTKNWAGRTLPANIEVETSLLAGLWPIEADAGSTESALLNLILNARDAMPDGGKLTIETANIRIDDDYVEIRDEDIEPGRYVMLAVTDTGSGIPAEILDKVFDPFFTTKEPGAGSGLGLAMIEGFMRQSGGTARVYSEPNVGTTFKLYFKAGSDKRESGTSRKSKPKSAEPAGERILVVEDEPGVLDVLIRILSSVGYEVESATTGDEALEKFIGDPSYELILTDIVMPGTLQGTTLARELRKRSPQLPIVFMSGYASEATVHGNGLRPDDIRLMKPVRRAELLRAIDGALQQKRSAP